MSRNGDVSVARNVTHMCLPIYLHAYRRALLAKYKGWQYVPTHFQMLQSENILLSSNTILQKLAHHSLKLGPRNSQHN